MNTDCLERANARSITMLGITWNHCRSIADCADKGSTRTCTEDYAHANVPEIELVFKGPNNIMLVVPEVFPILLRTIRSLRVNRFFVGS